MKLIGITGKKGSGKTTLAWYIKEAIPISKRVEIYEIGEQVSREISNVLPIPEKFIADNKRSNSHVRALLQFWGNYKRIKDKLYWLHEPFESWLEARLDTNLDVVILSSIKFPEEAEYLKIIDKNNRILKIEGRQEFIGNNTIDQDKTETEVDNIKGIDYTIVNDKNLNWLKLEGKNISHMFELI